MSHSFNVEMVEEHDDGSATFNVSPVTRRLCTPCSRPSSPKQLINGIELRR
jgi:hypothetical protein